MQYEREYKISVGEHGGWRTGLDEVAVSGAKLRVHREVTDRFRGVELPWTLELETLLIVNGIHQDPRRHLTIPEEVHLRTLQGWLAGLRPQLRGAQKLWINEGHHRAPNDIRCCSYPGNNWVACDNFVPFEGETARDATPWTIKFRTISRGRRKTIEIPILIQVSWPCEVVAPVRERTKERYRPGQLV